MVENREIASRIKNIRLNKGWTLEQFGEELGASKVSVHNWESGRNLPNKKRLKRIAEIGNITIEGLLYGSYKNVIRELIDEANHYSNNGEFNELDLESKGLKDTLKEISSFYWRYYIKVANEKNEEQNHQEKIESLYNMIATKCKAQDIRMTDYEKIFQCIHSFFKDTIFLDSFSNNGFIDYTLDHLLNVTNNALPEYLALANKQNVSIDSELYIETNKILEDTMKKVQEKKKEYPNE